MNKRKRTIAIGICILALVVPLYIALAQIIFDHNTYLPIIYKQATFTPTVTPTPIPTPRPNLQDGYYSGNAGYDGDIWFTVTNGGTQASNAGFIVKSLYYCPYMGYSFAGPVSITNGSFRFFVYDYVERELVASFSCESISSTQATCKTYYNGSDAYCNYSTGVATLR